MRKPTLIFLACICLACLWPVFRSVYAADTTAVLAAQAHEAYAAERYADAADAYAELTWVRGARTADVWYNAGNAYAQAGRRGAAIAAYRTALSLEPGHTDAAANLAHLRADVAEQPATTGDTFLAWLVRPAGWVPLARWRQWTGVGWGAAWAAAAAALWRRGPWRRVAQCAAFVCVVGGIGWAAHAIGQRLEPRAIVVATVAPLRTGPGPDYLVTYSLSDGAECFLLAGHAGWVQLQVSDGGAGWTEAERVLVLPRGLPTVGRAPARWEATP